MNSLSPAVPKSIHFLIASRGIFIGFNLCHFESSSDLVIILFCIPLIANEVSYLFSICPLVSVFFELPHHMPFSILGPYGLSQPLVVINKGKMAER